MKKSTQKTIMALFIVFVFGLSSIAFFVTGLSGSIGTQKQEEFKPLSSFVVEGRIDSIYKSTYIQGGFTWVEYYYTESDQMFLSFLDSLPDALKTPSGQQQIIVQKINEQYLNQSSYTIIASYLGQESFSGNDPNEVFETLCRVLASRPFECGFLDQQNQSTVEENTTPTTENNTETNVTEEQT